MNLQQNPYDPYRPPTSADYAPSQPGPPGGGEVPPAILELMRQTKPWVTFLAVMGFIFTGLMVLGGLAVIAAGSVGKDKSPAALGLVYLVMAPLYIYPSICLLRYGSNIGRLLTGGGLDELVEALRNQKSFWRFAGITMVVMLVIYGLIFVGAMIYAVVNAASHLH
jgi:hypothetical protein